MCEYYEKGGNVGMKVGEREREIEIQWTERMILGFED